MCWSSRRRSLKYITHDQVDCLGFLSRSSAWLSSLSRWRSCKQSKIGDDISGEFQQEHSSPVYFVHFFLFRSQQELLPPDLVFFLFQYSRCTQNRSHYNIVDVAAFGIPLAASIQQLVLICAQEESSNNRALSFSVLLVFFHMVRNSDPWSKKFRVCFSRRHQSIFFPPSNDSRSLSIFSSLIS